MVEEYAGLRVQGRAVGDGGGVRTVAGWCRPEQGWVKVNTDAAIFEGGEAGLGVLVRDAEGGILSVGARRVLGWWTPEVAEAKALCFGLEVVLNGGWGQVVIESDAKVVVDAAVAGSFARTPFGLEYGTFVL
ncbi:uncharacterized protein LOC141630924 [Silene latifolia]|uniref:uncharacterized protein LOC141630924 n=1 Tax=Silene latifolia TaxID=37657 RepID=UPI003D7766DE